MESGITPKVTASIVVYNSPAEQVFEAIGCMLGDGVDKTWIIFNGPDGSLFNELRRRSAGNDRLQLLRVENRGFGAGHNVAMRLALEAGARYHLVANADIRWSEPVVGPMVALMDSDLRIGLAAPAAIYPDGEPQDTARELPAPAQLFLRRFIPGLFRRRNERYLLHDLDKSKPINAPYLLGCFMLFRCEALRKEGLFDERYFMYPEDIDITRRLHRQWLTLRLPSPVIIHDHARESRRSLRMLRIHMLNMVKYFNKWGWLRDDERALFNRRLRHPERE